ncbi:type II secretion system inner membrane protein GspF [Sansalvadorimonas sp. 2012CJ34-2]|uniref:General secretion pathway protein F n=1 Tax=Parendozoicomonas callyspongiae TaxID=2942213 RepID=A0ABT0PIC6_9GAMM|nr:type II secretion system inner membrane protein GspF [Sansalvadorimonas sp. 2012CJ34-2]MCL6271142.1 type II secretion system inner membrane protein GspF [Sansalvadorimonas sp. 2012CJ34-2]
MAAFEYTALDEAGKQQRGTLEADSPRQIRQMLRDKSWTPLSVDTVSEQKNKNSTVIRGLGQGLSASQLALITRQLATLIHAAMPVEEALQAVAAQQENRRLRNIVLAIRSRVLEGHTLANSMDAFPGHFPQMYRATVAAGEHAGYLDKVLNRLADYTEQRMQSRQKVQLALLYPMILMLAAVGIVSFLLGYVVPDVIKVFIDGGQELPLITELLIMASNGFQTWWPYLLLSVIIAVVTVQYLLKKPAIRLQWHRRILGLPIVGRFSRALNTSQFASTLSILTRSGVSLVDALAIASQVVGNDAMREAVIVVARKVSEGASLNKALKETDLFPPLMLHMIASGEATGELDNMLERTANNQQMELENRIAMLVGLFEPLMLVVMGGVVLLIVLAILLPILNMNTLIS